MMDVSAQIFLEQAPAANKGKGAGVPGLGNERSSGEKFSTVMDDERSAQRSAEPASASSRRNNEVADKSAQSEEPRRAENRPQQQQARSEDKGETDDAATVAEKAEGRGPEKAAAKMEEKVSEDKALPDQANAEHGQQQSEDRHAHLAELFKRMSAEKIEETLVETAPAVDEAVDLLPEELAGLPVSGTDDDSLLTDLEEVGAELEGIVEEQLATAPLTDNPVEQKAEPEDKLTPEELMVEEPQIAVAAQVQAAQTEAVEEPVEATEDLARRVASRADLLQQQAKNANPEKADPRAELSEIEELEATASADDIVEETLRQLERSSMKFEAILAAKNAHQRNMTAADLVDQLTDKMNLQNGMERASMSASSTGLSNSVGLRTSTTPGMPSYVMDTPVESDEWGAVFSKRIQFLAKNGVQAAEIRLDPPEMGRVNVKIKITNDQASIQFTAQHGNVRDAIEQTMPRLREMLSESGLGLGNVDVSTQQFAQRQQEQMSQGNEGRMGKAIFPGDGEGSEELDDLVGGAARVISSDSLVDFFA